jgi:hypothetical protein
MIGQHVLTNRPVKRSGPKDFSEGKAAATLSISSCEKGENKSPRLSRVDLLGDIKRSINASGAAKTISVIKFARKYLLSHDVP